MKQITCPHCGDTYPDFDVAHVCSKGPYAPRLKPKMNERIKELAVEAGMNIVDDKFSTYGKFAEKFAELIVRECANMAESFHHHQYDFTGNLELHEFIKEHFGVEECWCESCKPNTMTDMRMILCQICGNKRCPHATNHIYECTNSNEPGQKGSSWENYKVGVEE